MRLHGPGARTQKAEERDRRARNLPDVLLFLALSWKLNALTRDQAAKSLLVCCVCFTQYYSGIRYLLGGLQNTDSDCKVWNEMMTEG